MLSDKHHQPQQTTAQASACEPVPSSTAWQEPELIRLLRAKARARGHTLGQLASALHVTPGYLTQLRNGNRYVHQVSRAFACACAQYLQTSVVSVLLSAKALQLSDFTAPSAASEQRRQQLLQTVLDDPTVGACIDQETLFRAEPALQALVVKLHAQVTFSSSGSEQLLGPLHELVADMTML
jgi:transcriptional regulator with XRE-family HTH domain